MDRRACYCIIFSGTWKKFDGTKQGEDFARPLSHLLRGGVPWPGLPYESWHLVERLRFVQGPRFPLMSPLVRCT